MKLLVIALVLIWCIGLVWVNFRGHAPQWQGGTPMSRRSQLAISAFFIGLALCVLFDDAWPAIIVSIPAWFLGYFFGRKDEHRHEVDVAKLRATNAIQYPQLNEEPIRIDSLTEVPKLSSFEIFDDSTGKHAGRVSRGQLCKFLEWYAQLYGTEQTTNPLNQCYILEEDLDFIRKHVDDENLLDVLANAVSDHHEAYIRWTP